jgi:ATP-binding cassette subfamily F protein uup
MAPPILHLRDIALSFGGTPLLLEAELAVGESERICVVGRNGSGKSTLLKIAAGQVAPDRGERFLQPGTTLRYLSQEPDLSGFASVHDFVRAGLAPGDDEHRATYLLQQLGLDPAADPAKLSGGEARRAALARALAPQPDILLLDEPTNHLDLPAIEWLEGQLLASRGALVMISHDRRFLERLSRATLWLDRGKTRRLDQGFKDFEAWRDAILEREETEQHKLVRKIAAETEWLHKGVTARRRRNQGRLRALMDLRKQRRQQTQATGNVVMTATEGRTSGKLVIEARGIAKAFAGTRVVDNFSIRVMRGERVGLVGPNGAGKTTLVNLLTGALAPDSGSVRLGANIQLISLDQRRAGLDPDTTLSDALTGGQSDSVTVGGQTKHVISYMKDFLFLPEQARTPLRALSGGERGRLMLARALARPSNLLVLDEPTNDLDLETLDLLQEMLADYQGTVLLVSHDRDFLDRVVTATIAAEGDGRWTVYAGGYSDMAAQRAQSEPAARKNDAAPGGQAKRAAAQPSAPSAGKRKLSFKEKHALETLPKKIAKLEAEAAALRTRLAAPDLYARDRTAFEAAAKALEQTEDALTAAEDEWLSLEMLRESLQ